MLCPRPVIEINVTIDYLFRNYSCRFFRIFCSLGRVELGPFRPNGTTAFSRSTAVLFLAKLLEDLGAKLLEGRQFMLCEG